MTTWEEVRASIEETLATVYRVAGVDPPGFGPLMPEPASRFVTVAELDEVAARLPYIPDL